MSSLFTKVVDNDHLLLVQIGKLFTHINLISTVKAAKITFNKN